MEIEQLIREEAWLLREKYDGYRSFDFIIDRERLRRGEPLAYIIGWVPFISCKIWLDSHPLIPRPETEHWVEKAIKEISDYRGRTPVLNVLDLGAGSGCIGVAIAKALPEARVDFGEIDTRHHKTIEKSIRENGIDLKRTSIFGGDLFAEIPAGHTYDAILSNPPYIDPVLDRTDENVRMFEPHEALYGGRDGLEVITRIIKDAPVRLSEKGVLYIEHEPEQAEAIRTLVHPHGFRAETHTDQFGIGRYSKLTRTPGEPMA